MNKVKNDERGSLVKKMIYLSLSLICFMAGLGGLYFLQFQHTHTMVKVLPYCFGLITGGIFLLARVFMHRKCPICKNEVSKNDDYCPFCHEPLSNAAKLEASGSLPKPAVGKYLFLGLGIASLVFILVMLKTTEQKEIVCSDYYVYEQYSAIENEILAREIEPYYDYAKTLINAYFPDAELIEKYTVVGEDLVSVDVSCKFYDDEFSDLSMSLIYTSGQWELQLLGHQKAMVSSRYGLAFDYHALHDIATIVETDEEPLNDALRQLVVRDPTYDGEKVIVECERGEVVICYENSLQVSYTYTETLNIK